MIRNPGSPRLLARTRSVCLLLLVLTGCADAPAGAPDASDAPVAPDASAASTQSGAPIVFVCEHGSVKSLMAASLFDRAAARRGLALRAISRGVAPDASVPPRIAAGLLSDGFDVSGYRPQALSPNDLAEATRVIAIGVDVSSRAGRTRIESWNDVPAASVDYDAASDALERHIEELLRELEP